MKTARPVRCELAEVTRQALDDYLEERSEGGAILVPWPAAGSVADARHYARLVSLWITGICLDRLNYTTHSAPDQSHIYRRTGILRAVQLLLGHRRIDYVPGGTMSRVDI